MLGRAGSSSDTHRALALKKLWLSKVSLPDTLDLIRRVFRLLYHLIRTMGLMEFQQRTQLVHSVQPAARYVPGNGCRPTASSLLADTKCAPAEICMLV